MMGAVAFFVTPTLQEFGKSYDPHLINTSLPFHQLDPASSWFLIGSRYCVVW